MQQEHLMRIWFAAWNGDIQRAREEYDRREAGLERFQEMQKEDRIPERCKSQKHALTEATVGWQKDGRWRCKECRNAWSKKRWRKVHPQRRKIGPKKKLSWPKQQEVALKYRDGALTRNLVAEYNVSKPAILRAVRNAGVPVLDRNVAARIAQPKGSSSHLSPAQREQIVARYIKGESSADIGVVFDVAPMTVLRTIRNAGVSARTRSESMKMSHANRRATGRTA